MSLQGTRSFVGVPHLAAHLHRPWTGPSRVGLLERSLPIVLYAGFLFYVFVGVAPMSDASGVISGAGSSAEQITVLALFAVACAVMALRAGSAFSLFRASWPVWGLVAWFGASIAWSAFPDIALRRIAGTVLVTVIGLGCAVSIGSLRRAHTLLLAVLAGVIVSDLVVTVLVPGFAVTAIGVRGLHPQKNVAGVAAMVTVIAAAGWTVGVARPSRALVGAAVTALSGAFLVMTLSKTSLMLTVLATALLPLLIVLRRCGATVALLFTVAALAALGVAATMAAAFNVNLLSLVTSGGDTTFTGRTEIWDFVRSEIARRPWTGFGFGSFWDVGEANNPLLRAPPGTWLSQLRLGGGVDAIINEAHNGYLDLQLQGGLPALIMAVAIVGLAVVSLARKLFAPVTHKGDGAAAATFLLIMLVFLAHNFTESSIWVRGQILANLSILLTFLAFRREVPPEDEEQE